MYVCLLSTSILNSFPLDAPKDRLVDARWTYKAGIGQLVDYYGIILKFNEMFRLEGGDV